MDVLASSVNGAPRAGTTEPGTGTTLCSESEVSGGGVCNCGRAWA